MAAGAMHSARKRGLRIPQDLAVVGFDDVPEAPYYEPALSTIRQPLVELGGQAVELLNRILQTSNAGEESSLEIDPALSINMKPKIIIRESSIRA